ncbi:MAG: FKBP-type peptidyl-prolyl cis-trans isomerase [Bacteroidales bacterium]
MMTKKNKRIGALLIMGLVIISISSCSLSKKYEKEEEANIQNYLIDNPSLNYEKKSSGLYYLDDVVGTGAQVVPHDSVFVMYTGYYLSGTKFGTNVGTTDTLIFRAGEGIMIAGFDEAILYMKAGGKAKIICPSYLAYGTSGYGMPAYTTLLFDIYVVRLRPYSGSKK